ncbi:hypothetical protein UFOVP352_15 [uncultured Caudovirales phage]|uniref:DNA transfer protein n=1 Tax=uncultured Caudovirales phage TaxID=2100421 RepID=A0A6J5M2B4_9CAUD|nr:hypothetical protein UFOVP352_15 [uncultured Caudovirales phage]CAB4218863.1 hypothetical protein UFOVP1607_47 [uncultured Caudovirales phage]
MPDPATALIGGTSIISGIMGADAAESASNAQSASAAQGIAEQRRQFDEMKKTLAPYVNAGVTSLGNLSKYSDIGMPAFEKQKALIGLLGPQAQQASISEIENSPMMQSMIQQGENSMLQNASATGGLRGGNLQAALSQYRPQILSQLINDQYTKLGGLAGVGLSTEQNIAKLGQGSAANQAAGALNTGSEIARLLEQQGSAQAGGEMAQGRMWKEFGNIPAQLYGFNQMRQFTQPQVQQIDQSRRFI